jgi:threonine aldolase
MIYSFKNDYSEGAHPQILNALIESNFEQEEGYGLDSYTLKATEILKKRFNRQDIDVHFFSGGTQTNLTAISAFLKPYEAILAANTAHILVHETGAIEATGHKIISIETEDGKLTPLNIKQMLDIHTDEHMVKPRLVYVSNSTEIGTIYKKNELEELKDFCVKNNLILYMDGARLGSALCSLENDIELKDLPELLDAFYIGGTKHGALLGESLVICDNNLKKDFRYHMKQKGALLAKGRLIGIQFLELFKDNLYFTLARHANKMTDILRNELGKLNINFLIDSPSNQIFPILPYTYIEELKKKYSFYIWKKIDEEHAAIRMVTSWATKEENVLSFIEDVKKLINH